MLVVDITPATRLKTRSTSACRSTAAQVNERILKGPEIDYEAIAARTCVKMSLKPESGNTSVDAATAQCTTNPFEKFRMRGNVNSC
jgi:hypothetical protein